MVVGSGCKKLIVVPDYNCAIIKIVKNIIVEKQNEKNKTWEVFFRAPTVEMRYPMMFFPNVKRDKRRELSKFYLGYFWSGSTANACEEVINLRDFEHLLKDGRTKLHLFVDEMEDWKSLEFEKYKIKKIGEKKIRVKIQHKFKIRIDYYRVREQIVSYLEGWLEQQQDLKRKQVKVMKKRIDQIKGLFANKQNILTFEEYLVQKARFLLNTDSEAAIELRNEEIEKKKIEFVEHLQSLS